MKKIVLTVIFALLALSAVTVLSACGDDVPVVEGSEGLEYKLNEDGRTYYCDGFSNNFEGDVTSVTVASHVGGKRVTSIGSRAFEFCTSLTSVTLPLSVTSVGSYAFYDCASLTSVVLPDSVTNVGACAFQDCTRLTTVTLGKSVASIGDYAFCGCSGVTSITLGKSIASIGEKSFEGCYKLVEVYNLSGLAVKNDETNGCVGYYAKDIYTSLDAPSKLKVVDDYVFYADGGKSEYCLLAYVGSDTALTLPDKIDGHGYVISSCAFRDVTSLTSLVVPDGVTNVGEEAFYGCSSLTTVTLPASVKSIGKDSFFLCGMLSKANYLGTIDEWAQIEFGNENANPLCYAKLYINDALVTVANLTSAIKVSKWAFYRASLTEVTVGGAVTCIEEYAIVDCPSLTTVTVGGAVTSIGSHAFAGCSALSSVTLEGAVARIGDNAFSGCTYLTTVTLGDSVTSIGELAFQGCRSLYLVAMGKSVATIGAQAFGYCSVLSSVTLPVSVTNVGEYAFYYCTNLSAIDYLGTVAQWNAVTKGEDWSLNTRLRAVYCTDGSVA